MRKSLILFCFFFVGFHLPDTQAQYLFNFHVDAYKTDNRDPFEFADKAQMGLEFNYFLYESFAFTTGIEFWSNSTRFVPGFRYYPINPLFLRFRPLLGREVDYAFGAGYSRKITDQLRLEGIADYYFERNNLAIRFGIGYTLY